MKIDNLGTFQAGREFEQKLRPEAREIKEPETQGPSKRSVRYQKHQSTNRWMIKVVDMQSDEIIREIPDRKRLDMAAAMQNSLGKMQDIRC